MFTGLVEAVGEVLDIRAGSQNTTLWIKTPFEDVNVGDSVAVNGACLTAVEIKGPAVAFDVSQETLKRTNLKDLKRGSFVNLERALKVGDRLGGHLITGHVDFTATVESFSDRGLHRELVIKIPEDHLKFVVEKGSIAVDGISLTVNYIRSSKVYINVIPHTYENTNLRYRKVGDKVNVETDIIGKYVIRYMESFNFKRESPLEAMFGQ